MNEQFKAFIGDNFELSPCLTDIFELVIKNEYALMSIGENDSGQNKDLLVAELKRNEELLRKHETLNLAGQRLEEILCFSDYTQLVAMAKDVTEEYRKNSKRFSPNFNKAAPAIPALLQALLKQSENQSKYSDKVRQYGAYVRLCGGRKLHKFNSKVLPLPSISTTDRDLAKQPHVEESDLQVRHFELF